MKVIVNCDDFGYSERRNEATKKLLEQGVATSATIMANGPAFESAARFARQHQDEYSFGIHLNLTEFSTLSNASLTPLVNSNRRFTGDRPSYLELLSSSLPKAIKKEWQLQIHKCLNAGLNLTHFDSHHHIHVTPLLLPVLASLKSEFHINRIRPTKNQYMPNNFPSKVKLMKKSLYNKALGVLGFKHPTYFSPSKPLIKYLSLKQDMKEKDNFWECMIHPGSPNPSYQEEIEVLTKGLEKHDKEVELMTYRELSGAASD